MSPILQRPTRHIRKVSSQRSESYIQLNQYRLMEEIGQGSYGIVKLAYNEEDKNLYALKVLDKIKLIKNFACFRPPPARKSKAPPLTHRNPLQLVLDDPNDNYLYMVFEFVERGSILDVPTDKPLDEDSAWKYFRDTLRGLEYLHYQKIIHRDIKPSNLLLSDSGHVKVSLECSDVSTFRKGSNHFYSGRAQDIWSLGITLYAFVIGKVPFWDAYVIALHRKIKNDPIVFPNEDCDRFLQPFPRPHLSDPLKDLILG
ncbi:unnamed protein product, partial [Cylicostephanus goldi]